MNSNLNIEQKDLIEIIKLLEGTFAGKDTKKIIEAQKKLQEKFNDEKYEISLLLQALSINSIENKNITLEIHKSVVVYLKKIFVNTINKIFAPEELFSYLEKIIDLIFNKSKINQNLNNIQIFNFLQNIITIILSSKKIAENPTYIKHLFNILLNIMNSEKKEFFLQTSKSIILLCSSLLSSNSAETSNYEELLNNYYIPIVNTIFANVPNYLDPKNNIYNNEFIFILKLLFDGFFFNLSKMKSILEIEKRKDILFQFFREYGLYSYELLQLMPLFDDSTTKMFGKPNPIIVFNSDENKYSEINHMKSKVFQFLSLIVQSSTLGKRNIDDENKNLINDQELVELVNKIIKLIIDSFQDILRNKEKFYFLRKNREIDEEEDSFNILLFQICVFLTRTLIREPIKSQFSPHMKQFLLNILFPMVITISEEEIAYLDFDPEEYNRYIQSITYDFKNKDFRTSACFLIYKIAEKYEDMNNFILSFILEMLNFIVNEGKIQSEVKEYNVYLKNIKDALINQFNEEIKLDFTLLIILIMQNKVKFIPFYNNRLRDILIASQDKIHLVTSPIIKYKLSKIYNIFLPKFFSDSNDVDENIKKKFIENAINYLLNNIIQNSTQNVNKEYCQALSYGASDSIKDMLSSAQIRNSKENQLLLFYISQSLEKNFHILNKLIDYIDINSFFIVIGEILENIIVSERNLLFECLNNLTKKFIREFVKSNSANKLFINQYFNILNSFLTGKNKINPENKEEINKFNEIFDNILNYIKNPKKFNLYDELVQLTETYIKAFNGINERSSLVLKSIKTIIDQEKSTSTSSFNFVSTFLSYIQKNISNKPLDQTDLFNEILIIIKKSFSFKDETYESSKVSALLLTLQILNLNPNLPEKILSFLIIQSLNSFEYISIKEENFSNNINQLAIANISLGFIFKPELTFKILQQKIKISQEEEITCFEKFCHLIYFVSNIDYPDYNPLLGKCIILGMCGILTDKTCLDYLNNRKQKKLYLLKVFTNFILKHKREKISILNKMMKKELKCNFVDEDNGEEEEEEEEDEGEYLDEIDYEFNENIENILIGDNNINNSDEFKYYTQVMRYIKENEPDIYNHILGENGERNADIIEDLFKVRNIKIKYNDKEYTVPRKTVRLIKKERKL